jgi:hypothetical protein
MTLKKTSEVMRGITAVAQSDEFTAWKPVDERRDKLPGENSRGLVAMLFGQADIYTLQNLNPKRLKTTVYYPYRIFHPVANHDLQICH